MASASSSSNSNSVGGSVGGVAMQLMSTFTTAVLSTTAAFDDGLPGDGSGSGSGGGGDGGDGGGGGGGGGHGPLPTDKAYQGPWFSQQVELSLAIGLLSLLIFSALRRRLTVIFAPRTRLIQFAALKDHPDLDIAAAVQRGSIFSWIWPTLRVPDSAILHLVGLDAHILLQFHKMTFWLLVALAGWSAVVVMPVNYMANGHIDGVAPWEDGRLGSNDTGGDGNNNGTYLWSLGAAPLDEPEGPLPYLPPPSPSPQAAVYHFTHFITTYLITLLTLRFLHTNYVKYIKARQIYALGVLDSIPARTVEIRDLPPHLRDDRALADYFERMGLMVESTAVVRHSGELTKLLKQRSDALRDLERAWCKWLGNPTSAKNYDPEEIIKIFHRRQAAQIRNIALPNGNSNASTRPSRDSGEAAPLLAQSESPPRTALEPVTNSEPVNKIEPPASKPRPKMRASAYNPFSAKVDTLDELERRFRKLDAAVWKMRGNVGSNSGYDESEDEDDAVDAAAEREEEAAQAAKDDQEIDFRKGGRARAHLRGGAVGFVTFVKASSAQIASQVQHYPVPSKCRTLLAPEPRDIIWSNISLSPHERRVRQLLVSAFILGLLIFYIPPLTFLASFLSPQAIEKYLPWLAQLLEKSPTLRALVMNNASAILVAAFNGMLPMALEWSGYVQGLRARSLVEYSVLKKYYLFLVVSVIFVFLVTSTAWGVLADLANNPMKSLDKIAALLPGARNFSLAYVIFQALAIVPLGLLQLPYIISRSWSRMWTLTPREHAELNVPPMLYMGTVYPQALIVFTLSVLYGIVSPLLPVFGAIYFGGAYLVNKYKLIFVFYKSYESKGQAYPLSAQRMVFSLLLFQVFQFSLFSVRKQFVFSTLILPLLFGTFWYGRLLSRTFKPLSDFTNLQSIREMEAQGVSGDGGEGEAEGGGFAAPDELLPPKSGTAKSSSASNGDGAAAAAVVAAGHPATHPTTTTRETVDTSLSLTASPAAAVLRSQLPGRRPLIKDETLFVVAKDKHTDYREPPGGNYFPGVLNTGRRRYGHPASTGVLPYLWLPVPSEEARRRTQSLDALEAGEYDHSGDHAAAGGVSGDQTTTSLRRSRTLSAAPSSSSAAVAGSVAPQQEQNGEEGEVVLSLRRRGTRTRMRATSLFRRGSWLSPSKSRKFSGAEEGMSRSKTMAPGLGASVLGGGASAGKAPASAAGGSAALPTPALPQRASTGELHKTVAVAAASGPSPAHAELLVDVSDAPSRKQPAAAAAAASSSAASSSPHAAAAVGPSTARPHVAEPETIAGHDAEEEEDDDDEDDEAEEGVYIHRRSLSGPRGASTSL
ncbi:hypothetical protein OC835_000838 [Tilletia horrida]|nr:hypothetical protein OC835_000838 [Tilletia horrida]